MSAREHSRGHAGFSLIELMVALVAGSFVISGAYYLSDVSARMFNEQTRRAETQMSLRTAGEQLRRDIGRAGYLGVRDTDELWGCSATQRDEPTVSPRRQRGVRVVRDANGATVLYLTGNFTTSDQYPVTENSTPNVLVLSSTREGFRRSFIDPANGTLLTQRFLRAFAPNPALQNVPQGRMLSIQDLSTGRIFLRDIVAVNEAAANGPEITITPPLPNVGGCIPSLTTLVVAPLSTVRYMLEDPATNPELASFAATSAEVLIGGARLVLSRCEIDMRTTAGIAPTPIPGTTRLVLDFVSNANGFASFGVAGFYDRNTQIGVPPRVPDLVYEPLPDTLNADQQATLRSLVVQLVGESAENTLAPTPGNLEAASRVQAGRRLLRMEVTMPNMARNPGTI